MARRADAAGSRRDECRAPSPGLGALPAGAEVNAAKKPPPVKDLAVELAIRAASEFWHDPEAEAYVDVRTPTGARQSMRIRSRAFRTWLSGLVYADGRGALAGQSATDAVEVLGPEEREQAGVFCLVEVVA